MSFGSAITRGQFLKMLDSNLREAISSICGQIYVTIVRLHIQLEKCLFISSIRMNDLGNIRGKQILLAKEKIGCDKIVIMYECHAVVTSLKHITLLCLSDRIFFFSLV